MAVPEVVHRPTDLRHIRLIMLEVVRECADLRQKKGRMLEVVRRCADLRRWKHLALRLGGVVDLRVGSGLPALESCEPALDLVEK